MEGGGGDIEFYLLSSNGKLTFLSLITPHSSSLLFNCRFFSQNKYNQPFLGRFSPYCECESVWYRALCTLSMSDPATTFVSSLICGPLIEFSRLYRLNDRSNQYYRLFYISLFIVLPLTLYSVNSDCNLSLKGTSVSYFSSLVIDSLILFPFIQIVHAESEWYWGQFFDNVANSDYKEKAMNQLAIYLGK
jgi:hypothetical protein